MQGIQCKLVHNGVYKDEYKKKAQKAIQNERNVIDKGTTTAEWGLQVGCGRDEEQLVCFQFLQV